MGLPRASRGLQVLPLLEPMMEEPTFRNLDSDFPMVPELLQGSASLLPPPLDLAKPLQQLALLARLVASRLLQLPKWLANPWVVI